MIITVMLLLVFSWIFILIILLYILMIPGSIFFKQQRIGKGEKIFAMVKFRTLRNSGLSIQERRFWFGDFLRFTSLDELPQLINVLKGEMSLVGPRPLPVEYLPLFTMHQRQRHQVRPGITGLAQVNGKNDLPWEEKFDFDVRYVKEISFWLDLKILIRTILLFFSFRQDVSLKEKPFTGTHE